MSDSTNFRDLFSRPSTIVPWFKKKIGINNEETCRKFFVRIVGKTLGAEEKFIDQLKRSINLQQVYTVDECDSILVFCPVVSRAGTDTEAAMKKLQTISDTKPAVLVVFHHTFDPHCIVPDTCRAVTGKNMIAVDCLFHEDMGLLQCQRNNESLSKTTKYIKSLRQPQYHDVRKQEQSSAVKSMTKEERESGNAEHHQLNSNDTENPYIYLKNIEDILVNQLNCFKNCLEKKCDNTLDEKEKDLRETKEKLEKVTKENASLERKVEELENLKETQLENTKKELETSGNKQGTQKQEEMEIIKQQSTQNAKQLQEKDRAVAIKDDSGERKGTQINQKKEKDEEKEDEGANTVKSMTKEERESGNAQHHQLNSNDTENPYIYLKNMEKILVNQLKHVKTFLEKCDNTLAEKEKDLRETKEKLEKVTKENARLERKVEELENLKETQLENTKKELETSGNKQGTQKQEEMEMEIIKQQSTQNAKQLQEKDRAVAIKDDSGERKGTQINQEKEKGKKQEEEEEEGENTGGEEHGTKCHLELKGKSQESKDHKEEESKRRRENENTKLNNNENDIKDKGGISKDPLKELEKMAEVPQGRSETQHEGDRGIEITQQLEKNNSNATEKQQVENLLPGGEDSLERITKDVQEAQKDEKGTNTNAELSEGSVGKQQQKQKEMAPGQPGDNLMKNDKKEKNIEKTREEKERLVQAPQMIDNTLEKKDTQFKKENEEDEDDTNTDKNLDKTTADRQKEPNKTPEKQTDMEEINNDVENVLSKENKESHNVQDTEGNEGNKEKSSSEEKTKPNETSGNMKHGTESPQFSDVQTTPPETQKVEGDTKLGEDNKLQQDDTEKP